MVKKCLSDPGGRGSAVKKKCRVRVNLHPEPERRRAQAWYGYCILYEKEGETVLGTGWNFESAELFAGGAG
jgi:hypothetical protein